MKKSISILIGYFSIALAWGGYHSYHRLPTFTWLGTLSLPKCLGCPTDSQSSLFSNRELIFEIRSFVKLQFPNLEVKRIEPLEQGTILVGIGGFTGEEQSADLLNKIQSHSDKMFSERVSRIASLTRMSNEYRYRLEFLKYSRGLTGDEAGGLSSIVPPPNEIFVLGQTVIDGYQKRDGPLAQFAPLVLSLTLAIFLSFITVLYSTLLSGLKTALRRTFDK